MRTGSIITALTANFENSSNVHFRGGGDRWQVDACAHIVQSPPVTVPMISTKTISPKSKTNIDVMRVHPPFPQPPQIDIHQTFLFRIFFTVLPKKKKPQDVRYAIFSVELLSDPGFDARTRGPGFIFGIFNILNLIKNKKNGKQFTLTLNRLL